jgi:outer membrane protein assembly factor BamD (BamD/ComL family)
MSVETRILLILAIGLATASGCSMAPKSPPPQQAAVGPTSEEAEWWAANQHRKLYVPGKGYYVEGTSGFFDQNGRKLPTGSDPITGTADEPPSLTEKLSPKKAIARMKVAMGQGPDEKVARQALNEGDALFRQKEYDKAADKYKVAYKRWPDSPLEEEAIYKAAESHFFADRYSKADDDYSLLIKKFPSTTYLSQVITRRFAIGRYWEHSDLANHHWQLTPNFNDKTRPMFDTAGHAVRVYERIRLDDPTGPQADDAVMAAANFHFLKAHWEEADYHYHLLRSEFPKSEFQFQAHLLGLRCKLLRYQGPGYEGAPLNEAEELATQLLTQFPSELGDERQRVVQVRAGIRDQRALRDWEMAAFYTRTEHYGGARFYYAKIVKDFPDTKLAVESRGRLEQYKGLPDNPALTFQWLVNLLPASKRDGPVLPKELDKPLTNPATVASAPDTTTTTK